MILDLLDALARVNLAVAAAVLLVAMLRKPARRAFGARSAYLLWIVPLLAGLAALGPPAALGPAGPPQAVEAAAQAVAVAAGRAASRAPGLPAVLAGLWALGGVATALLLVNRQARFVSALGRLTPMAPRLYRAERTGSGPAVVGALFPRIVTPADFEIRFRPQEREVVLAHERAHLARGDAAVNAAAAAMLCLCWFNPLVHVAIRLMRLDQELACDAAVLGRFPQKRRLYAEVLLKTQLDNQALPFGCCWPPTSEHPLKERIAMLKSPLPAPRHRLAGAGLVTLLGVAAAAAAAWAAQPGQKAATPPAAPAAVAAEPLLPDWIDRPDGLDVARVYPAAAGAANLEGRAILACGVDGEGRLTNCKVASEAPAAAGFGEAALQLAAEFRMKAKDRNGVNTNGGMVRIPFKFTTPAS